MEIYSTIVATLALALAHYLRSLTKKSSSKRSPRPENSEPRGSRVDRIRGLLKRR